MDTSPTMRDRLAGERGYAMRPQPDGRLGRTGTAANVRSGESCPFCGCEKTISTTMSDITCGTINVCHDCGREFDIRGLSESIRLQEEASEEAGMMRYLQEKNPGPLIVLGDVNRNGGKPENCPFCGGGDTIKWTIEQAKGEGYDRRYVRYCRKCTRDFDVRGLDESLEIQDDD